jgi:feruloyl-CoA synthase
MTSEAVRAHLAKALAALATEGGSSTHPARLLILEEPASIDANEITDKGYINQRAVLERRAQAVERLHADPPPAEVIVRAR